MILVVFWIEPCSQAVLKCQRFRDVAVLYHQGIKELGIVYFLTTVVRSLLDLCPDGDGELHRLPSIAAFKYSSMHGPTQNTRVFLVKFQYSCCVVFIRLKH